MDFLMVFLMRFSYLQLHCLLFSERVYEEHELLVDNLMLWTRDSKNRLLFVERPERTLIFENPSLFNTGGGGQQLLQPSGGHVNVANFAQVSTHITCIQRP